MGTSIQAWLKPTTPFATSEKLWSLNKCCYQEPVNFFFLISIMKLFFYNQNNFAIAIFSTILLTVWSINDGAARDPLETRQSRSPAK